MAAVALENFWTVTPCKPNLWPQWKCDWEDWWVMCAHLAAVSIPAPIGPSTWWGNAQGSNQHWEWVHCLPSLLLTKPRAGFPKSNTQLKKDLATCSPLWWSLAIRVYQISVKSNIQLLCRTSYLAGAQSLHRVSWHSGQYSCRMTHHQLKSIGWHWSP